MRSSDPDMGHYRRAPGAYDILRRPRALRRGSRSLNADVSLHEPPELKAATSFASGA